MASVSPSPALLNAQLTAQLTARNIELEAELQAKGRENAMLQDRVEQLEELAAESRQQLATLQAHLKRLLGGRGLPMLNEGQSLLFDDAAASAVGTVEDSIAPDPQEIAELGHEDAGVPDAEEAPKKPKARRDRRKYDESNLKRELRRSELPEDQRQCPKTGVELVEVGTKVTTELDYRAAELVLIEHHQVEYGSAPEVAKERQIEPRLAPLPPVAVEGVTATAPLIAWLLCQKYVLHLPLYRQEDTFARLGVRLSRETLCDWVMKAAFSLRPVANEIARQIRASPVLQLDDTPIKVMRPGPGGERIKLRQSQLWVFVKPKVPGVAFRFSEGRSAKDRKRPAPPPTRA